MTDSTDLVEVLDLTFLFMVAGANGELAQKTYTVRTHMGDEVREGPGTLAIHYGKRTLPNGRELPGKTVTLSSADFVGMEREVRLEPRLRPSVAALRDPDKAGVEALKAKHGVN